MSSLTLAHFSRLLYYNLLLVYLYVDTIGKETLFQAQSLLFTSIITVEPAHKDILQPWANQND
jgi:hypothetical protein